MSADLDLCRAILRALAERPERTEIDPAALPGGEDPASVTAQLTLLEEAGLLRGEGPGSPPSGLSHAGREFLRLARNETLWQRVRGELDAGGGPVSLQMVRARLLEWAQFS